MLTTIIESQPKEMGGSGGKSMDDIVKDQALDLLSKMPPNLVEEEYRMRITALRGAHGCGDRGFSAPLNIFLFQELQRLQNILQIVRTNLTSLTMAIDGTVVMTTELLEDLNSVFDARVPRLWIYDPSGAEIAWLLPTIGGWFTGLVDRYTQLVTWLDNGRGIMKSYWLTGFTNAQGFLTGMRQEVTRQHVKDQWALDDVVTQADILQVDYERLKDMPEEGQNIHGAFLEGARWNKTEQKLDESEAKKLYTPLPVIYVTAVIQRRKASEYGPSGPYDAAIYKYPRRNDRYLIFRMLMKTDLPPWHWRLRGVCCMMQTD